jgi:lipoprotein-releasing system permease protein
MYFLAIKQLLARKRQTLLILLGIGMATTLFVLISALQMGMRESTIQQLMNNSSHIQISAYEEVIDEKTMQERFFGDDILVKWISPPSGKRDQPHILHPQGWFDFISEEPEVISFAERFDVNVIINVGKLREPAVMLGISPDRQLRISSIEDYILQGSFKDLRQGRKGVILGVELAKKLGARVDNTILVSTGVGEPRPFKVIGIFSFGIRGLDQHNMYAHILDAQQLNRTPGRITEIGVKIFDLNRAHDLTDRWAYVAKDTVQSWDEVNANFLQIFNIQDITRYIITGAILLVAGFGIYNILSIMVSQKRREIAILRSMGFPQFEILKLFLFQGVLLGAAGSSVGLLLGFTSSLLIESIKLKVKLGRNDHLILSYAPNIYITGFFMAICATLVASLIPSISASKLTPIEIIRTEVG